MISREGICENDSAHIQYADQDTMIDVICKSKCSDAECVGSCAYEVRWDIPRDIDPLLIRSIILHIQKMGAVKVIIGYGTHMIELVLVRHKHLEHSGHLHTDPKTYNFRTDQTPSYIFARFNIAQRLGG